jgi:hypothetical protein
MPPISIRRLDRLPERDVAQVWPASGARRLRRLRDRIVDRSVPAGGSFGPRPADRVASESILGDIDKWVIREAWNKRAELVALFTELAQHAIRAGPDVIIPSEGNITEFFYANGATKIGKAPVFDTFGIA